MGMMHLFLPVEVLNSYYTYTDEELAQLGPNKQVNMKEFVVYIGLELATSLVPLNQLRFYWRKVMFSRHQDFQQVMARQQFLAICRNLILKANIQAGEAQSAIDPLHSGCHLINTVAKSFAEVAVPVETSALDEASFRLNAQNKARSFCCKVLLHGGDIWTIHAFNMGQWKRQNKSCITSGTIQSSPQSFWVHSQQPLEQSINNRSSVSKCIMDMPNGPGNKTAPSSKWCWLGDFHEQFLHVA